jgi:hypothetical protein
LVCSTTTNSAGSQYSYVRCNSPGCKAAKHRIPHDRLEETLVFIRLVELAERIEDHREAAATTAAPSAELLNQRRRVAKLQALADELGSPGVLADLQQALERLAKLEPVQSTRAPADRLSRLTVGSERWWERSSPAERNAELLETVRLAEVDLTAWRALPPPPEVPAICGDPVLIESYGRWQRGCAVALVPVLELR